MAAAGLVLNYSTKMAGSLNKLDRLEAGIARRLNVEPAAMPASKRRVSEAID
jgi:hypothetical protein